MRRIATKEIAAAKLVKRNVNQGSIATKRTDIALKAISLRRVFTQLTEYAQ